MTKEQVINFLKSEIECGKSILVASMGNGGAGAILVNVSAFVSYLQGFEFVGVVEPSDDIKASPFYDPSMHTYQFDGTNGFFVQLQVVDGYDL